MMHCCRVRRWKSAARVAVACGLVLAMLTVLSNTSARAEPKKHYWATSLHWTIDSGILQGLREAVARGEVGWLDIAPRAPVQTRIGGVNLIFYHVGGNCRIGADCDRFPASQPPTDGWGESERTVDLNDPQVRNIVVADLVKIVQLADQVAAKGSTVGVHVDNVHRLDAEGLAVLFNEYLRAVEAAKQQGLVSKARKIGYIAKNIPHVFRRALDRKLLDAAPLYQVNENARLLQDGTLDRGSRAAQQLGRRYGIPVFLKTFGTDVAYDTVEKGNPVKVYVSEEMTRKMALLPDITGAAWSADEARYQPTLFAQGAAVREVAFPYVGRID
jgi:hypothetical protein